MQANFERDEDYLDLERLEQEEDFVAHVTDIAYQTALRHGLRRPFLEVELEVWRQVRAAFRAQAQRSASSSR